VVGSLWLKMTRCIMCFFPGRWNWSLKFKRPSIALAWRNPPIPGDTMGRYLPEVFSASGLTDVQIRSCTSHRTAPFGRNVQKTSRFLFARIAEVCRPYLTPRRLAEFDKLTHLTQQAFHARPSRLRHSHSRLGDRRKKTNPLLIMPDIYPLLHLHCQVIFNRNFGCILTRMINDKSK
jgi:hypothetical protein